MATKKPRFLTHVWASLLQEQGEKHALTHAYTVRRRAVTAHST